MFVEKNVKTQCEQENSLRLHPLIITQLITEILQLRSIRSFFLCLPLVGDISNENRLVLTVFGKATGTETTATFFGGFLNY